MRKLVKWIAEWIDKWNRCAKENGKVMIIHGTFVIFVWEVTYAIIGWLPQLWNYLF